MVRATAAPKGLDDTRVTRGRLLGKMAGALLSLAVLTGGGGAAFGLTLEGAGVVGNGLMLSLFRSSKTPAVTMVMPGSPAPTFAHELPSSASPGSLPSPLQVAENPSSPARRPATPGGASSVLDFTPPPAAATSTVGPTAAVGVEAPEPTTLLLVGTGLLVLAGTRRCRRRPRSRATPPTRRPGEARQVGAQETRGRTE